MHTALSKRHAVVKRPNKAKQSSDKKLMDYGRSISQSDLPYLIRVKKGLYLSSSGQGTIFGQVYFHFLENVDMSPKTISLPMMQCDHRPYSVNILSIILY